MRLIDADWIKDRNSFVPKYELHTVEEFLQILDEAPTIDAVPVVRGRWLGGEYDGFADGSPVYDSYICSACGIELSAEYEDPASYDYCPYCGAKMDGGADNGC